MTARSAGRRRIPSFRRPDMQKAQGDPFLARQLRFSTLVNRNVNIEGRRTSVRLEPAMWAALARIAERESLTINQLCTRIDHLRDNNCGLTAAIRVFLMAYFQEAATEEGHARAGHGSAAQEPSQLFTIAAVSNRGPAAA